LERTPRTTCGTLRVTFRLALAKAKITDYIGPFHDQWHSAITHDAVGRKFG
jgi:hypothetical protein